MTNKTASPNAQAPMTNKAPSRNSAKEAALVFSVFLGSWDLNGHWDLVIGQ
jgi:hypothetical protein